MSIQYVSPIVSTSPKKAARSSDNRRSVAVSVAGFGTRTVGWAGRGAGGLQSSGECRAFRSRDGGRCVQYAGDCSIQSRV
jgi:hypothetical protein